jgi:hypothetical protein
VALGPRTLAGQRALDPAEVYKYGDAPRFGPGITHASHRVLKYELIRPAHVIVLLVSSNGQVEQVFPERDGDKTEKKAGRHGISVGDVATAIRQYRVEGAPAESKIGRFDPQRGGAVAAGGVTETAPLTYWLVIASDVPTTALELQSELRALRPVESLDALVEVLPKALVGPRTTSWASYVTQAIER